jgi:hypothetical protein
MQFLRLTFDSIRFQLGLNSAPFVMFYPAQKGPILETKPNKDMWSYDFNAQCVPLLPT